MKTTRTLFDISPALQRKQDTPGDAGLSFPVAHYQRGNDRRINPPGSGAFAHVATGTALALSPVGMRPTPPGFAYRVPLLVVLLLLTPSAQTFTAQQAAEPRRIEIVARRFAFEPAQITVVTGEAIELDVRSADGVHGLEIRKLKIKEQIPRGETVVRIPFTAPAPGRYPIACSEYCGANHDDMKGMLVVLATGAPAADQSTTRGE
jgi:cytochrome c oxidase subunit 2